MKRYFLVMFFLCDIAYSCNSDQQTTQRKKGSEHFFASEILKTGSIYGFGDHINNAVLSIKSVQDTGLSFLLEAANGGNQDMIEGFAHFINDSEARFKEESDSVHFYIRKNSVFVSEEGRSGSVGIDFNGEYIKGYTIPNTNEEVSSIDFIDSVSNIDLKAKSGNHYSDISDCMNNYDVDSVKDSLEYKVFSGFVNGLGTLDEAIILTRNNFYYAGLVLLDTVHLYTNDPIYLNERKKMPKTIKEWIPKMSYKEVVFNY